MPGNLGGPKANSKPDGWPPTKLQTNNMIKLRYAALGLGLALVVRRRQGGLSWFSTAGVYLLDTVP